MLKTNINSLHVYKNPNLKLKSRIENLISLLSLDEKIKLLPTRQAAIERLNISEYSVGGEAAHGVVSNLGPSTVFPQPLGLASTFNKSLLKDIGSVIGDEARIYYEKSGRKGGLTLWAPTIDMERDPRWGRTEEAYGEDPILTGKLSSNLIQGMQGNDDFYLKLVPAPKHFYGNNNEEGRIYCSSSIDKRNKNEYYLKAFKPAFTEGKAKSMMTAYNSINGTPCILNSEVQEIVKDKWGCDGFIVCDGGDFSQTVEYHKYYETHAETIAGALKSGVDCFTDDADLVINSAKEALSRNLITEEDINKAVTNILKVRFRLGEFDYNDDLNPYTNISESKLCSKEHSELSLKACLESIVLLKNENNILPLKKDKINNVAVIGPLANEIYRDWYCATPPYNVTVLDSLKNEFNNSSINFHTGNDIVKLSSTNTPLEDNYEFSDWGFNSITLKNINKNKYLTLEEDDKTISSSADNIWGWFVKEVFKYNSISESEFNLRTWDNGKISINTETLNKDNTTEHDLILKKEIVENGIETCTNLAKNSDVAIVVVGNHPLINAKEEIDRPDIILPPHQEKLIKSVYSANPNTIVVVISSYPFALNWCNENVPAIIHCTHGCQELGNAITKCLFGEYNPAGRLPMTWYKSTDDLPSIMNYDIINSNSTYMYFKGNPLYEFGYGLSYTNFKYSNLIVSSNKISSENEIKLDFLLENIGPFAGDEVVQLYVSLPSTRAKRPIKQLLDFDRVYLDLNECKWISFTIKGEDLKYFDVDSNDFILESGLCSILIGSSSKDIKLKKNINIIGKTLTPRDLSKWTKAENYDECQNIILEECSKGGTSVYCPKNTKSMLKFSDVNLKEFNTLCIEGKFKNITNIELRIDNINGDIIGSLIISEQELSSNWNTFLCQLNSTNSIKDLYLLINGDCSINSLKLL